MNRKLSIVALSVLGIASLGIGLGVGSHGATAAHADTHTHDFTTAHTCSCGAFRLEAEYAYRSHPSSSPTTEDGLFIGNSQGNVDVGLKRYTSQYMHVGNWDKVSESNPYLEWVVTSPVAQTVSMDLIVSNCCAISSGNQAYKLNVNGNDYTTSSSLTPCDYSHWYRWENLTYDNVSLAAGRNTIKAVSVGKRGVNIDCLDVYCGSGKTIKQANGARLEAENGDIVGTPQDSTVKVDPRKIVKETAFYNNNEKGSNGASIGNFVNGDTNVWCYFNVSKASKVKINVFLAWPSQTCNSVRNIIYGFGVDGYTKIGDMSYHTNSTGFSSGSEEYYHWMPTFSSKEFDVTAGDHYVKIECANTYANIDCVDVICVDGSADVRAVSRCVELDTFVSNYMHMSDYNENLGWCKDSTHHYYSTAKTAFNALSGSARGCITDNYYAAPYARLQAWATANNDVFSSANLIISNNLIGSYSTNNYLYILVGLACAGIATLLIVKKKKKAKAK